MQVSMGESECVFVRVCEREGVWVCVCNVRETFPQKANSFIETWFDIFLNYWWKIFFLETNFFLFDKKSRLKGEIENSSKRTFERKKIKFLTPGLNNQRNLSPATNTSIPNFS